MCEKEGQQAAEGSHLQSPIGSRESEQEVGQSYKPPKSTLHDILPPAKLNLLKVIVITSIKHHQLESNVHIHELMGSFPIQTTTLSMSFSITARTY